MDVRSIKGLIVAGALVGVTLATGAGRAAADPVNEDLTPPPLAGYSGAHAQTASGGEVNVPGNLTAEVDGEWTEDIIQDEEYGTTAMPSKSHGPDMVATVQFPASPAVLDCTCCSSLPMLSSSSRRASARAVNPSARSLVVGLSVVLAASRNLLLAVAAQGAALLMSGDRILRSRQAAMPEARRLRSRIFRRAVPSTMGA